MRKHNTTPANHAPSYPDHAPSLDTTEQPRRKRRWLAPVVTGVAGLALGGAMFGGGGGEGTPAPTATETVTAEAKPAPTVTETAQAEAQEVTPESCLVALEAAEAIVGHGETMTGYAAELAPMVGEAAEAGYLGDAATLQSITQRMQEINAEVGDMNGVLADDVDVYLVAAQQCRAGSL